MTECEMSANGHPSRLGGMDSPPPASPVLLRLPLLQLRIWAEEQRPPVRATAWWPSLQFAAELGFPRRGSCFRGRVEGKVRDALGVLAATGAGGRAGQDMRAGRGD